MTDPGGADAGGTDGTGGTDSTDAEQPLRAVWNGPARVAVVAAVVSLVCAGIIEPLARAVPQAEPGVAAALGVVSALGGLGWPLGAALALVAGWLGAHIVAPRSLYALAGAVAGATLLALRLGAVVAMLVTVGLR